MNLSHTVAAVQRTGTRVTLCTDRWLTYS